MKIGPSKKTNKKFLQKFQRKSWRDFYKVQFSKNG
jgi:hypothetical protein